MAEQKTKQKEEEKPEEKKEEKVETQENKTETEKKKETKPSEPKQKEKAVVNARALHISLKHCVAICKMLKGKTPEKCAEILEEVVKGKRAVPMPQLEVAHQKGKGIAGARFPKKASLEIIELLKQLRANAIVNGVENPIVTIAKANKANMPFRRSGRRAKRTHVYFEVRDRSKLKKIKKRKT